MVENKERTLPKSLIRIVDIMMRLLQGDKINTDDFASLYGVNKRTIYRDLQVIRENPLFNANYQIEFDSVQKNRFVLSEGKIGTKEILAIIQIVIGTRALSKPELAEIIQHLRKLVPTKDQAKVDKLLRTNYIPVKNNGDLLDKIDIFTQMIESKTVIDFTYQGSLHTSDNQRLRQGVPISLYFADYYFYVVIYSEAKGSRIYRLDRILSYTTVDKKINVPREKWEDGDSLRNFTYLLNGGRKSYFKIKYRVYPQTALDKLPNSRVVSREADGSVIIEGYLFIQGLKHWLLSQGTMVKVLEPASLVEEIKQELQASLKQYK